MSQLIAEGSAADWLFSAPALLLIVCIQTVACILGTGVESKSKTVFSGSRVGLTAYSVMLRSSAE